ncbi:MAG: hypothetical protein JWO91_540 [Acidobacteriaceae bacterium]|nr:hypothetical protein [Acidobacteriaceae bacterium]
MEVHHGRREPSHTVPLSDLLNAFSMGAVEAHILITRLFVRYSTSCMLPCQLRLHHLWLICVK